MHVCDNGDVVRLRIDLAYDGTNFHGWARQPSLRTVQGELEHVINAIMRIPDASRERGISVVVAGRTDSGVHAAHQVCHMDIDSSQLESCVGHMSVDPVHAFTRRLRHELPNDIAINRVGYAPEGFDARFSALQRTYVYRICDSVEAYDPRLRNHVLLLDERLDVAAMNQAVSAATGLHDFGSFATANPGGTTIREVKYAHWMRLPMVELPMASVSADIRVRDTDAQRPSPSGARDTALGTRIPWEESGLVCFQIVADAFAHNMVRCLVNACTRVGMGRKTPEWFAGKVTDPVREGATGPAPACGLTLERVEYPSDDMLGIRAQTIRAKRTLP